VLTEDSTWYPWSAAARERHAGSSVLVLNPIIFAEVSIRFTGIEELEEAIPPEDFRRNRYPGRRRSWRARRSWRIAGGAAPGTRPCRTSTSARTRR
jgi:hypothetical protein